MELLRTLSAVGYAVTCKDTLFIIDAIVNFNYPEVSKIECSEMVLRRLFKKYKDLKVIMAASIEPSRANKATFQVRDAVFTKLKAEVQHLYHMEYVPWDMYEKTPPSCIYNMDEVGVDATKHRNKIITSISNTMRSYCITNKGDNKNEHAYYMLSHLKS